MIVRLKRTIFLDKGDKMTLLTFSVYVIMFLVMRPEAKWTPIEKPVKRNI